MTSQTISMTREERLWAIKREAYALGALHTWYQRADSYGVGRPAMVFVVFGTHAAALAFEERCDEMGLTAEMDYHDAGYSVVVQ
jgi:hypothetical protein